MSSREVRIRDNGTSYTVTTGENVVIGHADVWYHTTMPAGQTVTGLAYLFLSWRAACPTLSDSRIVEDLLNRGLIPGPSPDES